MAVRPPGLDDLAAIARGYGMHLSDEDLGSFEPMVAGQRFDAAACLRVADAFERLTGGFPAPPGAAGPA